ncbi:cytochrome c3 family protein [Chloroflexota bacterium]
MRSKWVKRVLPLTALLCMVSLVFSGTALASTSPFHDEYLNNEDNCATCHRTNTPGVSEQLKGESNQAALCYTCHGRNSSRANTNVQDGTYSNGEGLRGGGFEYATMDPGLTGTPSNEPVTSSHIIDNSLARAWGGGKINSTPDYGNMINLECNDCHNPHGNGNYRMLRALPYGMSGEDNAIAVEVPDEISVTYTITYDETTHYRDVSYVPDNLDKWCAQCHTRYSSGINSGHTDSGDAVFAFGHTTENMEGGCLQCHTAHGTTATMESYSGEVNFPDGAAGGGANDSRLLSVNNRGTCIQCHSGSALSQN